jgi:hypothetical protein
MPHAVMNSKCLLKLEKAVESAQNIPATKDPFVSGTFCRQCRNLQLPRFSNKISLYLFVDITIIGSPLTTNQNPSTCTYDIHTIGT